MHYSNYLATLSDVELKSLLLECYESIKNVKLKNYYIAAHGTHCEIIDIRHLYLEREANIISLLYHNIDSYELSAITLVLTQEPYIIVDANGKDLPISYLLNLIRKRKLLSFYEEE
jgi:hypothetical protein